MIVILRLALKSFYDIMYHLKLKVFVMILKDLFKKQGDFCFRWRSYLPLVVVPMFFLSLVSFGQSFILFAHVEGRVFEGDNFFFFNDELIFYNTPLVILALLVGLIGQGIRILVVGYVPRDTSGRNTKEQKASQLNTTGMYSLCRNPLYLGNFLMMLAPVLLLGNWLFVLCFCLAFWLYYERIIYAEESFLTQKFGDEYLAWASKTPAFFPQLTNYSKSAMNFSFKATLKREYHSLFGLASSLFLVHCIIILFEAFFDLNLGFIVLEPILTVFFIISALIYLITRVLSKKTKILEVKGR